jgi:hypothetical protein
VLLQLEVVVLGPEEVAVPGRGAPGLLHVAGADQPRHLGGQAGREADQPLVVALEQLAIEPRLVVEALGVRLGRQLDQVLVAGQVAREQDQVVGARVDLGALVEARVGGDVRLDADDRLDAGVLAGVVEVDRGVQDAVVGEGQRRRALLFG